MRKSSGRRKTPPPRRTQGLLQRIGEPVDRVEVEINGWGCLILVFLAALFVIASFGSQPLRPPY